MAKALNDVATIILQYGSGGYLIFIAGMVTTLLIRRAWKDIKEVYATKSKNNKGS